MAADQFIQTVAGHEDDDFRVHRPEGVDTGECPLVSVWVCAYNHEKYIRECLEGVVSQKTTFTYEVIVTDDCSTDSTQAVILEYAERYPTLIRPILGKRNLYSTGRKRLIEQFLPLARGKYISFCEGDDYWTYDGRLQALADFLETHPRHSMCFHAYRGLNEVKGVHRDFPGLKRNRNIGVFEAIIESYIHFAALLGRKDSLMNDQEFLCEYQQPHLNFLDTRIYLAYLNAGKIFCFIDKWSVYRSHANGMYTGLLIQGKAEEDTQRRLMRFEKCYDGRFKGLLKQRIKFISMKRHLEQWTYARRSGKYAKAICKLTQAFTMNPRLFLHIYFRRYIY